MLNNKRKLCNQPFIMILLTFRDTHCGQWRGKYELAQVKSLSCRGDEQELLPSPRAYRDRQIKYANR